MTTPLIENPAVTTRAHHPASLVVNLAALSHNCDLIADRVGVPITVVVKADAYGHGAIEVARVLEKHQAVAGFAAAHLEEGLELRRAGVRGEILVLSSGLSAMRPAAAREACAELVRAQLTLGVSSVEELMMAIEGVGAAGHPASRRLRVHLKVDTGMTRAGLARDETLAAVAGMDDSGALELAGIYTHFAESEDLESDFTDQQLDRFEDLLAEPPLSRQRGAMPAWVVHAANSAAALYRPRSRYHRVRIGGALYGLDLATSEHRDALPLAPVMSVRASLVQVRDVPPGTTVGYGRRWRTQSPARVGLVPIGYADGYRPNQDRVPQVLVLGRRVPVVGAISMDLTTIDLTGTEARAGDEVVLLGRQGTDEIRPRELAWWSDAGLYQVVCALSRRLPRCFQPS
jgi:alanine racemase